MGLRVLGDSTGSFVVGLPLADILFISSCGYKKIGFARS